jgi:membrane protein implicated in regulation of membrane protease activity
MDAFWNWLGDNEWSAWLGVAFIFGIVETTTLDLVFLMLAGGAASGAIAAVAGANLLIQSLAAIAVSVGLLGVVRPVAKRHLHTPMKARTGAAALIGRRGVVLQRVGPQGGRIKLAGEIWTARCFDGESVIEPGSNVDVIEIQGATALVFDADR